MKKPQFFAVYCAIFAFAPLVAGAANYPVYNTQNKLPAGYSQPVYQQPVYQQVQSNQYLSNNALGGYPAAANPTRITGNLPRVGSNATNAGRQYYQPQNFDRLSDSGLYVGLSFGYSSAIQGGMLADYQGETNAWYVPGAFKESNYKHDTVLPLQLSVGASINNDVRVDFSYTRYSGISYSDAVQSSDGMGGYVDTVATGGGIAASATMLNLYYNIDSYTGYLAGGSLRPYIGFGIGISTNTIADYLVYDPNFYSEVEDGTPSPAGALTAISDIYAYHAGGTVENLAYSLEGGVSTELEGGVKLDFFVRYAGLGRVQSSGSIVVSQTEWLGTGYGVIGEDGAEEEAPYDSVFHYTNWYESGKLGLVDIGIRMRLQF